MKLFISYSRDDKHWVFELYRALRERAHHDAWIDQRLLPAQDWWVSILKNIEECDCFLYVMSPLAVDSIYCRAEMLYAIALGKPVLPVMLKPCTSPSQLSNIQYLTLNEKMSIGEIIFEIERGLGDVRVGILQGNYESKKAPRPAEPQPKSKQEQAKETYLLAEEAYDNYNYSLAEKLWQQVVDAEVKNWSKAAQQRLDDLELEQSCLRDYQTIASLLDRGNIKGARAAWDAYIESCGTEYDPNQLAERLKPKPAVTEETTTNEIVQETTVSQETILPTRNKPSNSFTIVNTMIFVVLLIAAIASGYYFNQLSTENSRAATQTSEAFDNQISGTQTVIALTSTEAYFLVQSRTPTSTPTVTETVTSTPTLTPNAIESFNIASSQTAYATVIFGARTANAEATYAVTQTQEAAETAFFGTQTAIPRQTENAIVRQTATQNFADANATGTSISITHTASVLYATLEAEATLTQAVVNVTATHLQATEITLGGTATVEYFLSMNCEISRLPYEVFPIPVIYRSRNDAAADSPIGLIPPSISGDVTAVIIEDDGDVLLEVRYSELVHGLFAGYPLYVYVSDNMEYSPSCFSILSLPTPTNDPD